MSGVEPSSYDLNLNYAGRPMSTGRGDIVLASERSVASCVGCHESDGTARNVHRSGSNSLFFDGHVEAIPTSKPVGGTSRPTK